MVVRIARIRIGRVQCFFISNTFCCLLIESRTGTTCRPVFRIRGIGFGNRRAVVSSVGDVLEGLQRTRADTQVIRQNSTHSLCFGSLGIQCYRVTRCMLQIESHCRPFGSGPRRGGSYINTCTEIGIESEITCRNCLC